MGKVKTIIERALLRHRVNRKISRALRRGVPFAVLAVLASAAPALANPTPRGQELRIYAGGGATARGDAYGSEHTIARLYFDGYWHAWSGCYRSTWSVHLWVCNNVGSVPVRHYAYAQLAYYNANGWSFGNSPWVYSSCCETHQSITGVLG